MSTAEGFPKYGNYIDGAIVPPASSAYLPTENPYSGKVWALIGRGGEADVAAAAAAAERALTHGEWPRMSATQRGHLLWRLGDLVIANVDRLAVIEQRDNGKIASEAIAQVRYMGDYFKYYAGLADKVQGAVIPTDKRVCSPTRKYEPKGVIAIITPWNSPLTLTSWKLAPALAAGCTAVIKPSEFTSASMLEFAPLFAEAGFPKGVVNVVTGLGAEVGAALVAHPSVAHVGFTGGDAAGRKVYQLAAAGLKTVTLELGGKSPNIVFDDADLDQAVKGVVSGIFAASGQSCQAGSRLLLQQSIHDRFVEKLLDVRPLRQDGRPGIARHADRSDRDAAAIREGSSTTSGSRKRRARAACSAATAAPTSAPACSSSPRSSPT